MPLIAFVAQSGQVITEAPMPVHLSFAPEWPVMSCYRPAALCSAAGSEGERAVPDLLKRGDRAGLAFLEAVCGESQHVRLEQAEPALS